MCVADKMKKPSTLPHRVEKLPEPEKQEEVKVELREVRKGNKENVKSWTEPEPEQPKRGLLSKHLGKPLEFDRVAERVAEMQERESAVAFRTDVHVNEDRDHEPRKHTTKPKRKKEKKVTHVPCPDTEVSPECKTQ